LCPTLPGFPNNYGVCYQNKTKPQKHDITPNPHPHHQKVSQEDIITRFCNVASYAKCNFFLKKKKEKVFEKCARHTMLMRYGNAGLQNLY